MFETYLIRVVHRIDLVLLLEIVTREQWAHPNGILGRKARHEQGGTSGRDVNSTVAAGFRYAEQVHEV